MDSEFQRGVGKTMHIMIIGPYHISINDVFGRVFNELLECMDFELRMAELTEERGKYLRMME